MTTIVHALTPIYNKVQSKSVHNNSTGGIDATSWPAHADSPDPFGITIGRYINWDYGVLDDRGGIIVRRGSVHFDVAQAFAQYTKITGQPAPTSWKITRATLSFMYNSLGISWEANGEVGSIARYGSQLNQLFYTTGQQPLSPTKAGAIAVVPPFDPRHQKTPATVKTSEIDHLAIEPKVPKSTSGMPRISVPLAFVTKPGGYNYHVDGSSPVDGSYWIDLTGKLGSAPQFGIVFAGSPAGESTKSPGMDVVDFGAAVYFNFFLNVKIEF